ncbi:hypothetical protein [Nonomuraea sp. CA-141351]
MGILSGRVAEWDLVALVIEHDGAAGVPGDRLDGGFRQYDAADPVAEIAG